MYLVRNSVLPNVAVLECAAPQGRSLSRCLHWLITDSESGVNRQDKCVAIPRCAKVVLFLSAKVWESAAVHREVTLVRISPLDGICRTAVPEL